MKKITVITIVFNDVKHIKSTINSIISQTAFNNVEYVIVDGASTDGTSKIIKQFLSYIDFYICEPDKGIYNAMNKGLNIASGEYVIFINSGDRLSDSHVIQNIIGLIGDSSPDVVYGHYREVKDGQDNNPIIPCRKSRFIWYGPVASHQSTIYRKQHLTDNNICYDESYRIAADYKLTAQAITKAKTILKTDVCISDFDISGVSSTNQDLGLKEANRVRREVFNWSPVKNCLLTCILLSSRYFKRYLYPFYSFLRH